MANIKYFTEGSKSLLLTFLALYEILHQKGYFYSEHVDNFGIYWLGILEYLAVKFLPSAFNPLMPTVAIIQL